MNTLFRGPEGGLSMRRFVAFLFAVAGVSAGIIAICMKADWQTVSAAFGVPGVVSFLCLVCTTVSDVTKVVETVKELKQ